MMRISMVAAALLVTGFGSSVAQPAESIAAADDLGRLSIVGAELEAASLPPIFIDHNLDVIVLTPESPSRLPLALAAMRWLSDDANRDALRQEMLGRWVPEYMMRSHRDPLALPAFPEYANARLAAWLQGERADAIRRLAETTFADAHLQDAPALITEECPGTCRRKRYCESSRGFTICGCRGECFDCCSLETSGLSSPAALASGQSSR